ncbi:MAG TPA: sigma-54 dependent transcriptional regulator [Verrucomicrobiae bacterium]|nr:sigma-54 dependent transcriptional regulator [Verrucomicrobiae bacterium]
MSQKRVLIVDDEENLRHMLSVLLKKNGYRTVAVAGGAEALAAAGDGNFDFILCDIRMPQMDGMAFLQEAVSRGLRAPVIMMSAYGNIDTAIECMKNGAYDYISKPFNRDEILLVLRKAEERERLKQENLQLRDELAGRQRLAGIITCNDRMKEILQLVRKVADFKTTILILGESGTGKELFAKAIHTSGSRSGRPFIAINCAAIPETLLESELFGHVRGAFTDAAADRVGLFEAADGGTIFLDEIGEMPPSLQVKLLRVLQEGEIKRLGSSKPKQVDVRVISATSRDLAAAVAGGAFREDLLYRLNVFTIELPPLRERVEDIPLLAGHFIGKFSSLTGGTSPLLAQETLKLLALYPWPGNVRELENVIERALILSERGVITPKSLPPQFNEQQGTSTRGSEVVPLREAEKRAILGALEATGGNRTHAARLLEISLRGLLYKLKEYGIG